MIQLKELLAAVMMDVMLAALMGQRRDSREGGTSGQETRVLVSGRIDNQNCLAWFAKGRAGSELGNRLLRFHWWAMMSRVRVQHELDWWPGWAPFLPLRDRGSRTRPQSAW